MKETLHIYTRVSTTVQEDEGTSLDTQKELGLTRSEKLGFDFKLWNEGGQSSAKDDLANRPVLMELLSEVDEGNVKHIYVWNTDRLSRNLQTWGMIRFKLIKNEVTLHTPTGEQILSDPQTNMLLGILSEISQYDNSLRTERFRLGKIHRLKQGGWKGGPPPFGYEIIDGKLSPHPDEKNWVKQVYEMYADKKTIRDIRKELQSNGVKTRRGNVSWGDRTIEIMLSHTHYQGFWYYKDKKLDEPFKVDCPRILDDDLVNRVILERKKRTKNSRVSNSNEKYFYLLKNILRCGHCGLTFSGRISKKQSVYYCPRKERNFRSKDIQTCNNKRYLRIPETDKLVWDTITQTLSQSNLYKETFKEEVMGTNESHSSETNRLKTLNRRKKKLETEISDFRDTIVRLETDKVLKKSRSTSEIEEIIIGVEAHRTILIRELGSLQSAIDGISNSRSWVNWVKKFSNKIDNLDSLTPVERKDFIENTVTEISVETTSEQTHKLHIEFMTPLVGDKLVWRQPNNKSLGYDVNEGKFLKTINFDVGK